MRQIWVVFEGGFTDNSPDVQQVRIEVAKPAHPGNPGSKFTNNSFVRLAYP